MKIKEVRTQLLHHPGARLVEDGTTLPLAAGAAGRRQLCVELATDEGVSGFAVGYAPPGAKSVVNASLAPVLVGQDPATVGELWTRMMWAVRDFGRGGIALQAISTVDVALWDLLARIEGLPLHRLLGDLSPEVVVYGSGGFTSCTRDELVAEMSGLVESGFNAVKMKVGKSFGALEDQDLERVRAVAEVIGPSVALYVDANGAYGVEQAIRMSERFADLGVGLFEEPVPAQDLAGLVAVRKRSPIPVATGEHEYEISGLRRLAEADAADVLQPDALRIGGVTGWRKASAVASEFGLPLMSHAAQLASLSLGCSTPGFVAAEYMGIQAEMDRMWYQEISAPRDGLWAPADEPGLGLELRSGI